MVKTRHSQEPDDESSGNFLSLESRASTRTRVSVIQSENVNDHDSDDSGVINFKKSSFAQQEDSYVKPRSLRSKRVTYVEDYLEEDSDIEDALQRSRPGRGRRAVVHTDDDSHDEQDGENGQKSVNAGAESGEEMVSRRASRRHIGADMPVSHGRADRVRRDNGPVMQTRRSAGFHHSPRQVKREELVDIEDGGTRRSSRNRQSRYHTYNQEVLGNSYPAEVRPKRKRQVGNLEVNMNDSTGAADEGFTDIYSRVKRQRKTVKRDMYGMPIETDNEEVEGEEDDEDDDQDGDSDDDNDGEEENEDDDNDDDDNDDDDEHNEANDKEKSYNLRKNKPRTQLYNAPVQEKRPRNQSRFFHDEVSTPHSPARRRRKEKLSYLSPARRRGISIRHKRRAFHGNSSTSSSDSSSSDEERFQRRKAKSMMKARQSLLPMNFDPDDVTRSSVLRDRQKIGSSLADVDPMAIDKSITFDSVGGLGKHVRALKEMVVFPLLYPEIFDRFKIAPPRGVLFYGPPGTGKTLVARALANECSQDDRRVAFYMRKGADCLSKWVGESERQLRLLFDQAYQTRPSIIFFDEIDGLAPVRSSRQDQIHSSIVSTLLALMDGLDSRGEIVVIGATNRLDSIDPALRRPGRFDREFLFPLPSVQARGQILKIHTREWNPKLCDKFVSEVAEKCIGYCGADVKALCTEAALLALRRRYPQIYTSSEKLQIDVTSINISARDFHGAIRTIVPASQRSVASPARALSRQIAPLLQATFVEVLATLNEIFPTVLAQLSDLDAPAGDKGSTDEGKGDGGALLDSDDDERDLNIYEHKVDKRRKHLPEVPDTFLNFNSYASRQASTHRPRLLLCGSCDRGQTSHLAPAVLHHLEQLPVHVLDLPSLYAVSARTPEESCAHIFREARRTAPSIVFLPHISQWWPIVGETVRSTLVTLIHDLDPSSPVLLLATSEQAYDTTDFTLQDLFDEYQGEVYRMRNASNEERREYFKDLLLNQATQGPPSRRVAASRELEVLPKAPPPEPRKLTDQELKKLEQHEEATLTELRLFLRDVLNKLGRDRKFFIFTKPVDIEDVPDYYDIIKKPMDLSTMMSKIDLHHYQSVKEFLEDISQICLNALEYNPDKDPQSRVIRHRACALKDTADAIMKAELDPEFEKICEGIVESRKKRGEEGTKSAPSFYYTRPLNSGPMHPLAVTKHSATPHPPQPIDPNLRLSRRLRGVDVGDVPSLEDVEKTARTVRSLQRISNSPEKTNQNKDQRSIAIATPQGQVKRNTPSHTASTSSGNNKPSQGAATTSGTKSAGNSAQKRSSSSSKKPARKNIWGPSTYRRRKRKRRRLDNDTEEFTEILSDNDDDDDNDDDEDGSDNDDDDNEQNDNNDNEATAISESQSPQKRRESTSKSPGRDSSETRTSHESVDNKSSAQRSPSKTSSVSDCLSVDVEMKSPSKDCAARSPSQRSPRSVSQRSPRRSLDDPVVAAHRRSESCPISARTRHSIDSKSPGANHNIDISSPKALRSAPKSEDGSNSKPETSKMNSPVNGSVNDVNNSTVARERSSPSKSSSAPQDKSAVKALVNGFVDSGLGSSDSSGDSNDSHGKLLANQQTEAGDQSVDTQHAEKVTQEPMEEESEEKTQVSTSPILHLTRARVMTRAQEQAAHVISELREPVVIDRERLVRLLDMTVMLTDGYTLPRLEKLHSVYAQCVYVHRLECNKTQLLEDMEKKLKQYTSSMAERMRAEKARALTNQLMDS